MLVQTARRRAATRDAGALLLAAALVTGPGAAQVPTRSVTEVPRSEVEAAARAIDRLIDQSLRARRAPIPSAADDATFVRRAYLDIVGRIPTPAEAQWFASSRATAKRERLVDALLDAPGAVSHAFHYWADLLRAKTRLARQVSGEPYLHWLKQALVDNLPYDEMVRQLLTANGPAHARDNGATGYYLRDQGMPLDNMANTARVFLGTRLECAQCHNHPFDSWTQKQFFQMAAYTGGLEYRFTDAMRSSHGREVMALNRALRREDPQAALGLRRVLRAVTQGVDGSGAGRIPLPQDYQYDDAAPLALVTAEPLFGEAPALDLPPEPRTRRAPRGRQRGRNQGPRLPEADTRAAYAEWLTSPDNPRFTTVIANRMWKRVFGRGLIEPVDDLRDDSQASHAALLELLEQTMFAVGYDLKQFQRVLLSTRAYQREAAAGAPEAGEGFAAGAPLLRRMTAEQIWDSVLTLVVDDLDENLASPDQKAEPVYRRYEELAAMDVEQLRALAEEQKLRYTDPERFRAMMREQRRARAEEQREGRGAQQGKLRDLRRALAAARRARDAGRVRELRAELEALARETLRRSRGLVRASDLPSPAPPGHFLREFGQSDREQIEAASADANVPQVLTLLNGFIEQHVLRRESALMRGLAAARNPDERMELAFQAILARPPTGAERALWKADVRRDPDAGTRDLVWTLLNTHEFRFVR